MRKVALAAKMSFFKIFFYFISLNVYYILRDTHFFMVLVLVKNNNPALH